MYRRTDLPRAGLLAALLLALHATCAMAAERLSMSVQHADIAELFETLSRQGQTNILLGAGLTGEVSVSLYDVTVDEASRTVERRGRIIHLTATEFDLLRALAMGDGAVLTREQLLSAVWGYRDGSGARTVDSHVRALRRKLGDGLVRTVHGVGYAIAVGDEP